MNTQPSVSINTVRQHLGFALAATAESAWSDASGSHHRASSLCALVACGHERNVSAATAALHLASFDAMTLAQVGEFTGALDAQRARALMEAAKAGQGRALELEARHLADSLAPSDVFFDDVLPKQALGPRPQGFANIALTHVDGQPAPASYPGDA